MSALEANRTCRDGGNDVNDPERSFGKHSFDLPIGLVRDRAVEAWYHPSIA